MNLDIYDIKPAAPTFMTPEDYTVAAIAYRVWSELVSDINLATKNDNRPWATIFGEYAPMVICRMLRMAEEKNLL